MVVEEAVAVVRRRAVVEATQSPEAGVDQSPMTRSV
jgi:hypothetical protein